MSTNQESYPRTVLYVDDEEKNLSSFKAVFKRYYNVYVATSAAEGIEMLEKYPVQLVITDQRMPNMTGVEFLEQIADRYPDITRIILTGYSDTEAIIQAINKGKIFRYITKPWKKDELQQTIDSALEAFNLRLENNKLIETLRKTNAQLDRFLYSTAHDLRAPYTSLRGLVNLMKTTEDMSAIREFLHYQEITLDKIEMLIQEISEYSRITRREITSEPIDFDALLYTILGSFRYYADAEHLHKTCSVHQPGEFFSDKSRLHAIISNLVSNCVRFRNTKAPSSWIKIEVVASEQEANITISDNGIGIAQEHIDRVFDMFYRATEQNPGAGLGLFLVKEAVERLAGSISISSQPMQGTSVHVVIPNNAFRS